MSGEQPTPPQEAGPPAAQSRSRLYGLTLAIIGVLIVSPDSLMLRYASSYTGHADPLEPDGDSCHSGCGLSDPRLWTTLMLKNAFQGFYFLVIFISFNFGKSCRELWRGLTEAPWHIAVASLLQGAVNVLFPLSLLQTTSARALMFIAVNPLWAAVLGRILNKERMAWPTVVALFVALGAIALVFVPSVIESSDSVDGTVHGDLISLLTGSCLAALLTANRRTSDRYPKALLSISGVLGSFVSTMACLPPAFALPIGPHVHHEDGHHDGAVHSTVAFGHTLADLEPIFWPLIMVDAAMIVGCVLTAMMLAPRFISGTQVALILLLENILGPLFVYMSPQFREVPSIWTLVGGGILLVTLAVHEVVLWHLRAGSSTRPRRYCPSASSCETGSSGKSGNKLDRAMYRVGTGRLFARIRSTAPGSESTRSLEAVISAPTGEVDVEGAPQRERC